MLRKHQLVQDRLIESEIFLKPHSTCLGCLSFNVQNGVFVQSLTREGC